MKSEISQKKTLKFIMKIHLSFVENQMFLTENAKRFKWYMFETHD